MKGLESVDYGAGGIGTVFRGGSASEGDFEPVMKRGRAVRSYFDRPMANRIASSWFDGFACVGVT